MSTPAAQLNAAQVNAPLGRWLAALAVLVVTGQAHGLERPADLRLDANGVACFHSASTLQLPPSVAVDLSELEMRLFADASDGRLDQHSRLEAALVASGVASRAELHKIVATVEDRIAPWRQAGLDRQPAPRRAEMLFARMHGEMLTGGYRRDCSDLTDLLETGRFNCVSATVLWQCLAETFELLSTAIESPGHVHAQTALNGGWIELETTCPQWFEMLDDPARQQAALAHVGGGTSSVDRELTAVGLLAAIYYNRGIALLEKQQFAEAVAANAKALRLDPHSAIAHGNLLAALNNWALHLGAEGDFERATELLAQSRAFAPQHATFSVNYVAVHQQWIDRLMADGRLAEALALARRLERELPGERFFLEIQRDLRERTTR
jgi:tetratricopeptide (TPR) repeat protein